MITHATAKGFSLLKSSNEHSKAIILISRILYRGKYWSSERHELESHELKFGIYKQCEENSGNFEPVAQATHNFLSNETQFHQDNDKDNDVLKQLLPYFIAESISLQNICLPEKREERDNTSYHSDTMVQIKYNTQTKEITPVEPPSVPSDCDYFSVLNLGTLSAYRDRKHFEHSDSEGEKTHIINDMKKQLRERATFEDLNSK